jgi:hypothetical protein
VTENVLAELYRETLNPLACADGMCFVVPSLYARGEVAIIIRLKREGRNHMGWSRLADVGIPNFLAFGHWIVPNIHRTDALRAASEMKADGSREVLNL